MVLVEFGQLSKAYLQFKVLGVQHQEEKEALPSYIKEGDVVTLIRGKFPLDDYTDCNVHTYTFEKINGKQFTGILDGFTYDCTNAGQPSNCGMPTIVVSLMATATTANQ